MTSNIETISYKFSQGNFKEVYPDMSEDIEWNLIGASIIKGKAAVVEHCDKMLLEMADSTLNNTNHVISDDQTVVQGYCNYTDEKNQPCRVEYCDIYKFRDEKLAFITSYIVDVKNVQN